MDPKELPELVLDFRRVGAAQLLQDLRQSEVLATVGANGGEDDGDDEGPSRGTKRRRPPPMTKDERQWLRNEEPQLRRLTRSKDPTKLGFLFGLRLMQLPEELRQRILAFVLQPRFFHEMAPNPYRDLINGQTLRRGLVMQEVRIRQAAFDSLLRVASRNLALHSLYDTLRAMTVARSTYRQWLGRPAPPLQVHGQTFPGPRFAPEDLGRFAPRLPPFQQLDPGDGSWYRSFLADTAVHWYLGEFFRRRWAVSLETEDLVMGYDAHDDPNIDDTDVSLTLEQDWSNNPDGMQAWIPGLAGMRFPDRGMVEPPEFFVVDRTEQTLRWLPSPVSDPPDTEPSSLRQLSERRLYTLFSVFMARMLLHAKLVRIPSVMWDESRNPTYQPTGFGHHPSLRMELRINNQTRRGGSWYLLFDAPLRAVPVGVEPEARPPLGYSLGNAPVLRKYSMVTLMGVRLLDGQNTSEALSRWARSNNLSKSGLKLLGVFVFQKDKITIWLPPTADADWFRRATTLEGGQGAFQGIYLNDPPNTRPKAISRTRTSRHKIDQRIGFTQLQFVGPPHQQTPDWVREVAPPPGREDPEEDSSDVEMAGRALSTAVSL